jgi:uncharacterized HhH-GPD family protein
VAESRAGLPEPGSNGSFRNSQGRCYLAVVVPVHVPEHDGRRKLGRKRTHGVEQIRVCRLLSWIGRRGGPAEPAHDFGHGAQPRRSPVGDRTVHRDPVHPGLGRGLGAPAAPGVEGLDERVLRAILRRRGIAQQSRERPVHAGVSHPIEAVEILSRAGAVVVRHSEMDNALGYAFVPIVWTNDPAANELLETDPFALLIGMVLDQQVKMEKAFGGPYELKRRLGRLDAREIAAMDPERLDAVFRERPALHRFPGNMARRVQAMAAAIVKDYGGDSGSVWRDAATGDELAARISALPGFGEMKTRIMVSILAKKFDVRPPGWERHAATWHSVADVDSEESMAHAREVKRDMKAKAKR